MIIKPFVTFIKPTEPQEAAIFALSILSKYQVNLDDFWSFDDLVYLLALESESGESEQRIREVVQMSPLILNALKSTIRYETRREFVSQTLPKLLVYIKAHPEMTRQPIWIHQHQQILKLIQKQSKLLQAKPNKRVWENGELLPLVSKSELRQSGRRKRIQTLIRLIRSVETYYVDNNGPKAPQKALTINQYDAHNKEEIIKRLTKMLIKTYGLTPENEAKKNNTQQEIQRQKREVRTKELAYRTNVVLENQEKAPKNNKETLKTVAKYMPKWINKEANARLKRAEMNPYQIKQKDIIQKLEVLLHPRIYQNHRLSKVSRTLENMTENRALSRLSEVTARGQRYTLKPRDSQRLYEELSHYYEPNRTQDREDAKKESKEGIQLSSFVDLITKREDIKTLLSQYRTLSKSTRESRRLQSRGSQRETEDGRLQESRPSSQLEALKLIVKDAPLRAEENPSLQSHSVNTLDSLMSLVTKREDVKLLIHQFQNLREKTSEIREESEKNVEHYIQTDLVPKVSEQSSQMEQIKRISNNVFEEWKTEVSERINNISAPGLSDIEKIERSFTADLVPSREQLGGLVSTAVDETTLSQMTDLVINRVVDQVFDRVTEKIDRERRRRGL